MSAARRSIAIVALLVVAHAQAGAKSEGAPLPETRCVGRFRVAAPSGFGVAARRQMIYGVKVWTEPAHLGPVDKRIEERLGDRIISRPKIGEGVSAAWHREGAEAPVLLLLAGRTVGPTTVWALRDAAAGEQHAAEKLVGNVLAAFSVDSSHGFCVGDGVISLGPSLSESTRVSFRGAGTPELELAVSSQTVAAPVLDRFRNLDEERAIVALAKGKLTVHRDADRTIANLRGHEMWITLTIPGEPDRVRFSWHFAGVGRDGTKPELVVTGWSSPEQRAALRTAWEELMSSLASIPK